MNQTLFAKLAILISLVLFGVIYAVESMRTPNNISWWSTVAKCFTILLFFSSVFLYLKRSDKQNAKCSKSYFYEKFDSLTSDKEIQTQPTKQISDLLLEAFQRYNIFIDEFGKNFMRIRKTNLEILYPRNTMNLSFYNSWTLLRATIETLYWSMQYLLKLDEDVFLALRDSYLDQIDWDVLIQKFPDYQKNFPDGTLDVLNSIKNNNFGRNNILSLYFFFVKTK